MSTDYWKEREYYNLLKSKNRDKAYVKGQIEDIYNDLLLNLEREIRAEIVNFSNAEGISIGEAKKRIGKADIKYYESVAKKYVADKDFTEKANHEMKLYNITMRLNRLEFLNAILRAHIIGAGARIETSLGEHLLKGSIDEYKRQAGILNLSLADKDIERRAKFIVSQDYYNAHFSDRIWRDTKELQRRVARNIDSVVIQGNNPQVFARKLRDLVKGDIKNARSATERLAFTESGRVWVQTQIDAYRAGGYKYLEILTEPTACKECSPHNGDIVRLDEVREGDNVPLWHPRCRCTTVAYEVDDGFKLEGSGYNKDIPIEQQSDYNIRAWIREHQKIYNKEKYEEHYPASKRYINGKNPLTISYEQAQSIVNETAGTGELRRDEKGNWTKKEFINYKNNIGKFKGENTNRFSISYKNKKWVHIVPRRKL